MPLVLVSSSARVTRWLAREEWPQAFDLFMAAETDGLLAATDLALLGEVAYAAGYLDMAIEAWERAHAG